MEKHNMPVEGKALVYPSSFFVRVRERDVKDLRYIIERKE